MHQPHEPTAPLDPSRFREALARYASGVAVVSTSTPEGLHGVTVSAFAPVSARPPLVLVCLDSLSRGADFLAESGCYGVSILAAGHEFLADRFAGRGPAINRRFDDAPYFTAATGAPLLRAAVAWLDCRIVAIHEGGDHRIFVGAVEAAGSRDVPAALLHFDRRYWRLGT